jgi:hypothetical protein
MSQFQNAHFVQSLRLPRGMRSIFLWGHAQILILEIFNIFLRLKFLSSLTLNKIERFETGSIVSLKIMVLYLQISNSDELVKSRHSGENRSPVPL